MMMSGSDISPLFELADLARAELPMPKPAPLEHVMEVMQRNYELIRIRRAEAEFLKPIGWTIKRFNEEGCTLLPNFQELQSKLQEYELAVEILVAGFDPTLLPPAKIFTMTSSSRGIPARHDLPGFATIGSGGIAAAYMMYFRDVRLLESVIDANSLDFVEENQAKLLHRRCVYIQRFLQELKPSKTNTCLCKPFHHVFRCDPVLGLRVHSDTHAQYP
jgi:hypothetical protein